ncbi:MAG: hypothetical protein IT383_22270 [Deltaproteobacteria bacterium]|nr:hypothetical protein [Deltaproteobacteria bacterium]
MAPLASLATLRTFRAENAAAALEAARAALGTDACVVSTRTVRTVTGGSEIELLVDTVPAPSAGLRTRPIARPTLATPPVSRAPSFRLAPPAELGEQTALEERLRAAGVFDCLAGPIADGCRRVPGKTPIEALDGMLHELVRVGDAPWSRPQGQRIVALVGPTGVGKTTTLAKIAARALLDNKLRVALITLDSFRIGAVDHLRHYGEIMDLPTWAARDEATLDQALQRSRNAELVLIDTAGRSPSEVESFERQLGLCRAANADIVLVAAAATGRRQLRDLRERYAGASLAGLIVTKVDESEGPGAFLNTAATLGAPVLAWTDGQRVPEDAHEADLEWLRHGVLAGGRSGDDEDRG